MPAARVAQLEWPSLRRAQPAALYYDRPSPAEIGFDNNRGEIMPCLRVSGVTDTGRRVYRWISVR
jgi:hypothetical protein